MFLISDLLLISNAEFLNELSLYVILPTKSCEPAEIFFTIKLIVSLFCSNKIGSALSGHIVKSIFSCRDSSVRLEIVSNKSFL